MSDVNGKLNGHLVKSALDLGVAGLAIGAMYMLMTGQLADIKNEIMEGTKQQTETNILLKEQVFLIKHHIENPTQKSISTKIITPP